MQSCCSIPASLLLPKRDGARLTGSHGPTSSEEHLPSRLLPANGGTGCISTPLPHPAPCYTWHCRICESRALACSTEVTSVTKSLNCSLLLSTRQMCALVVAKAITLRKASLS